MAYETKTGTLDKLIQAIKDTTDSTVVSKISGNCGTILITEKDSVIRMLKQDISDIKKVCKWYNYNNLSDNNTYITILSIDYAE